MSEEKKEVPVAEATATTETPAATDAAVITDAPITTVDPNEREQRRGDHEGLVLIPRQEDARQAGLRCALVEPRRQHRQRGEQRHCCRAMCFRCVVLTGFQKK